MIFTRNPYTGTDIGTMTAINTKGMSKKLKAIKWYWWLLLAISIAFFITNMTLASLSMYNSDVSKKDLQALNIAINSLITNPISSKLDAEQQAIANKVSQFLNSESVFHQDFSNVDVYNKFVTNLQSGGYNRQAVDSLKVIVDELGDTKGSVDLFQEPIGILYKLFGFKIFEYKYTWANIIRISFLIVPSCALILNSCFKIFGTESGAPNVTSAAIYAYKSYLKGDDPNQKVNFFLSPNFKSLVGISTSLISSTLFLISSVFTIQQNQIDVLNNGNNIVMIVALVCGFIGLLFPIIYGYVTGAHYNYVEVIKNTEYFPMSEAINTVNIRNEYSPFMKKAEAEGRKVNSPNELREKLDLPPILNEESRLVEAYKMYEDFLKGQEGSKKEK